MLRVGSLAAAALLGAWAGLAAAVTVGYRHDAGSNRLERASRDDGAVVLYLTDAAGNVTATLRGDRDGDDDGLTTLDELELHGTDPFVADTDGDGLLDGEEVALGTDPGRADTDGDGASDGAEVLAGRNPLVNEPQALVPILRGYLRSTRP